MGQKQNTEIRQEESPEEVRESIETGEIVILEIGSADGAPAPLRMVLGSQVLSATIDRLEERLADYRRQTAGRQQLGEFAPEFARYNDDVLFGENWNNEDIDVMSPHSGERKRIPPMHRPTSGRTSLIRQGRISRDLTPSSMPSAHGRRRPFPSTAPRWRISSPARVSGFLSWAAQVLSMSIPHTRQPSFRERTSWMPSSPLLRQWQRPSESSGRDTM